MWWSIPELVAERSCASRKLVGRENVMGGTDCGFAQTPHVKRVHPSIMWAKLRGAGRGRAHGLKGAMGLRWGGAHPRRPIAPQLDKDFDRARVRG